MGGKEARDVFWFQDVTVLVRLLKDGIARKKNAMLGREPSPPLRVRVEAAAAGKKSSQYPLWDSTYMLGDDVVVDESKLGEPTRDHRQMMRGPSLADLFLMIPAHSKRPNVDFRCCSTK
ncbi:MAG TPA: hypothetical protein VFG83_19155 [Kofleriaceae bacterium]|nr:hypothetical protein [Kofleriaceae bacterium]